MDPRLSELKKYQIAIGAKVVTIEIMQTTEQAIELYKTYVSAPDYYHHESYKNICKKIEELFPEEAFMWSLEQ